MKTVRYLTVETEHGRVWVGGTDDGVSSIVLGSTPKVRKVAKLLSAREIRLVKDRKTLGSLRRSLESYFQGKRVQFDAKLDMRSATKFQKEVWAAVKKIPYGELRSYKEIAASCGGPSFARAVGAALRTNPFPIVIPCHRVIKSNHSLGGFASGLRWKRALILLEGGQLPLEL